MATGKRYYWMKLRETFMSSDAVDYLMGQPDGANYVVLYQMLCLKTINTDGRLERRIGKITIPYDVEKIQRDTKFFTADTIRVALTLYQNLGLMDMDESGCLYLVDHRNLVGSETDYAVQKKAQRGQFPPATVDLVHTDVHENVHTDIRDIEIRDKSLENRDQILEKESITDPIGSVCRTKDVRRITEAWNSLGLQQLTKVTSESKRGGMLRARVNEYGVDKVLEAIEKVRQSDFLHGKNSEGWQITFEWLVRPNNFPKVLEGNYDNRSAEPAKPRGRQPVSAAEYTPLKTNIDAEELKRRIDSI